MKSDTTPNKDDVVAIELAAPEGWKKKFTPKKGGTPSRNEIVFISPTGEEIKSKRQLGQYIKSHPGGPSASEFDWGTGDTPRRSVRLSVKSKAEESPESETPRKKLKKSGSKKGSGGENKEESAEVVLEEAEEAKDVTEEALADKDNVKDTKQKTNGEGVTKEAVAEKKNEMDIEQETGNKICDAKGEDNENKSTWIAGVEENMKEDENEKELPDPQAPSQLLVPGEATSSEKGAEVVTDKVPEMADAKVEDNKQAEKGEAPSKEAAASSEQEAEDDIFEDATSELVDAKAAGQENQHDKEETPAAEKGFSAEEANEGLKDQQEVGKPMENHSHEPKASQVS